jgi:hypothetical protein
MPNKILTATGWEQRIRGYMGCDLAYIPDSLVQQPDIISVAEANIIEQIPDYASLTDDKKVYLEAAVICECCSLLCPGMSARLPAREQGPSETHEINVDWVKKRTEFEAERDKYIGKIIYTDASPILFHFGLSQ